MAITMQQLSMLTAPSPRHGSRRVKRLSAPQSAAQRRVKGVMNKYEAYYAQTVLAPLLAAETIWGYYFEALQVTLCHNTPGGKNGMSYTPDFFIVYPDHLQFVEIKACRAAMKEDAWVKLKMAAELYDMFAWRIAFVNPKTGAIDEEAL